MHLYYDGRQIMFMFTVAYIMTTSLQGQPKCFIKNSRKLNIIFLLATQFSPSDLNFKKITQKNIKTVGC